MSARVKNLGTPDDTVRFSGIVQSTIELGDLTVARTVLEPGWRWANDVRPTVGGEWCQARHVGTVLSGAFAVEFPDGTRTDLHAGDVYDIPPGHDGYTVGDEACTIIEWAGTRAFSGFRLGTARRQLVTLLLTDVVDSTSTVRQLGDAAWRDVLSSHFEMVRGQLQAFGGREINTTGDGLLATFDAPAQALRCAASIFERSGTLLVRAGVHVGEVEPVGDDVRGAAVHEVARIAGEAQAGEVLVSETTKVLAAGLAFDERGVRDLKGIGPVSLYALRVAEA
ncbi:MAG TPA: adenylate/guanylate cyclase domain-containing protein [Acidimicrobiales bacterium]|nr:adenylate/guanylate cyclase domain-containing protein [Acidimicrobiales bacterium]